MGARGDQAAAYAEAGVDVEAADRSVDLIREHVARTSRPEVLGDIGGFAGAFAPSLAGARSPVLVSATDGVGTKLAIAQAMDVHDTVGIDAVAMVADDIACTGAEPMFFLDYISCGRLVPERIAAIVGGIADGCRLAGYALVGGETAEHPGVMGEDEYDIAGFGVGMAERDEMWGPARVRAGDAVIGLASSGLHANGFSLVRRLILDHDLDLTSSPEGIGGTLGEVLLEPTRIYAPSLREAAKAAEIHAAAHITGGGIAANVARALPGGLAAVLDAGSWLEPPIFGYLRDLAGISPAETRATFNCGLGMVVFVPEGAVDAALEALAGRGEQASVVGTVVEGDGGVTIEG